MDFGEPSRNGKNAMNFQYFLGGGFVSKNVPNLIPLKANMTTEASPFLIGDAVHLHSWLEFSSQSNGSELGWYKSCKVISKCSMYGISTT